LIHPISQALKHQFISCVILNFAVMKTKNYLIGIGLAFLPTFFSCNDNRESQGETAPEVTATASGVPAIEDLSRRIEATPGNAQLYAARGYLWYENENYDEGIADLEKAIELDSTRAEYFHALADMYLDYYKSRRALNVMERAGVAFPKRVPTLLKLAEFQLILKQHTQALFTLERIRAIEPLNAEMFLMFGNVFLEMGKNDQALNAYQSAVENDPDLIDAWINLGNLLAEKNSPLAEKYFDNAIRVDSNNIDALHAKAYFLSNTKDDLGGAIKIYKKINTIDPQYVDGYYNIGLIYLDMDSVRQAYQSFDLAVKFAPTLAGAHYHRGVAAELMGNMAQAKSDYENTLSLDPDYAAAKAALQQLPK
jgi:tetratricopeptide (TPR) repeat protein